MAKIKIADIPQDEKVSPEEMKSIFGGRFTALARPRPTSLRSALQMDTRSAIPTNFASDVIHVDCWSYTANAGKLGGLVSR